MGREGAGGGRDAATAPATYLRPDGVGRGPLDGARPRKPLVAALLLVGQPAPRRPRRRERLPVQHERRLGALDGAALEPDLGRSGALRFLGRVDVNRVPAPLVEPLLEPHQHVPPDPLAREQAPHRALDGHRRRRHVLRLRRPRVGHLAGKALNGRIGVAATQLGVRGHPRRPPHRVRPGRCERDRACRDDGPVQRVVPHVVVQRQRRRRRGRRSLQRCRSLGLCSRTLGHRLLFFELHQRPVGEVLVHVRAEVGRHSVCGRIGRTSI